MTTRVQAAIKEPEASSPAAYRRRVRQLAAEYAGIFVTSLADIGLIIGQGHLLVTLSQRSNVETLTLAFFLVFFGYLALLTAPGALGAARIAYSALLKRLGSDAKEIERRKVRALPPPSKQNPVAGLNVLLEKEGQPGEPFRIPVADEVGAVSELLITGAELRDADDGRAFEKQTQVTLGKDQLVAVAVEFRAPRSRYTPDAQVSYPPA